MNIGLKRTQAPTPNMTVGTGTAWLGVFYVMHTGEFEDIFLGKGLGLFFFEI